MAYGDAHPVRIAFGFEDDANRAYDGGVLEYRFTPRKGIPFPAFTAASADFPELRVEAEWDHDGVRGHALIENGRLVRHTPQLAAGMLVDVEKPYWIHFRMDGGALLFVSDRDGTENLWRQALPGGDAEPMPLSTRIEHHPEVTLTRHVPR